MAKVLAVDSVQAILAKSLPPLVIVHAQGRTPTSGWSAGRLEPYLYTLPPHDGILDFDFIATEPDGPMLMSVLPIAASKTFARPAWCLGVRVHSSTGVVEIQLGEELEELALGPGGGWVSSGQPIARDPGDSWPWLVLPEGLRGFQEAAAPRKHS